MWMETSSQLPPFSSSSAEAPSWSLARALGEETKEPSCLTHHPDKKLVADRTSEPRQGTLVLPFEADSDSLKCLSKSYLDVSPRGSVTRRRTLGRQEK